MYAIQAVVSRSIPDSQHDETSSRALPTFYLDEKVQGITDGDHAARIALTILDPWDEMPGIHITATRIEE